MLIYVSSTAEHSMEQSKEYINFYPSDQWPYLVKEVNILYMLLIAVPLVFFLVFMFSYLAEHKY